MRIAFCDDDASACGEFEQMLGRYRKGREREFLYTSFQSPLDLMASLERGERYDVLFLDIIMPGENGIKIAKEIRQQDSSVKIVFLTATDEYALQSYSVRAYDYLLKPVSGEQFEALMDSLLADLEHEENSTILLRCKDGITRVVPSRIEYCEVVHRTLFLHMQNGEVLESSGTMEELSHSLELYCAFLRIHRSYLINLNHIRKISYHAITMNGGAELPVPRGKYTQIKDAFLEYAFQNRQVMV